MRKPLKLANAVEPHLRGITNARSVHREHGSGYFSETAGHLFGYAAFPSSNNFAVLGKSELVDAGCKQLP
jgi:hypothetical protein